MNNIKEIFDDDILAKKFGIELINFTNNECSLKMTVLKSMSNGLGFVHGSIIYILAETSFYLLSNSNNKLSLTIDTNLSFPSPIQVGDTLIAKSEFIDNSEKTGLIDVVIRNQNNKVVGLFRGTFFQTNRDL